MPFDGQAEGKGIIRNSHAFLVSTNLRIITNAEFGSSRGNKTFKKNEKKELFTSVGLHDGHSVVCRLRFMWWRQ